MGKVLVGHRENQDQDQEQDEDQYQESESDPDPDPDLVCLDQEPCNYTDRVSDTPLSGERESIIQFHIHIIQFVS